VAERRVGGRFLVCLAVGSMLVVSGTSAAQGNGGTTVDGQGSGLGWRPAGSTTALQVTGRDGVPADATAVVLDIAVTQPRDPGFLTVFPCGSPRPTAANLNYVAGQTIANVVVAPVGTGGTVCIYTYAGTHLVADLDGYTPAGNTYAPLSPARLLDTRPGAPTTDGQQSGADAQPADSVTELQVAGRDGVPSDATAAVLNVAVTQPAGAGYLTVYPCGSPRPTAANLNYDPGETIANVVLAPIGADGKVCIYTLARTQLVADLDGYTPAGNPYVPLSPARLLDTRAGLPTFDGLQAGIGAQPAGATTELQVTGRDGVPGDATAAVLNIAVTQPAKPGFLTVYPCGTPRPTAANLNFNAGQTIANVVVAPIGVDGKVCIFTFAGTHLVADLDGYMPAGSTYTPLSPARLLDTRRDTGVLTTVQLTDDVASGNVEHSPFIGPTVSRDGRYVAFASGDTTVPGAGTPAPPRVGVYDTLLGVTARLDVPLVTDDDTPDHVSLRPVVAGFGGFVAFDSDLTSLIPDDTNGVRDVFVADVVTHALRRASTSSTGEQANGASRALAISADGRYVVLSTTATNVVDADTSSRSKIVLKDMLSGATTLISTPDDNPGAAVGDVAAVSDDGRYVEYVQGAANPDPTHRCAAVYHPNTFLRDTLGQTTTNLVRTASGGDPTYPLDASCNRILGHDLSMPVAISADGRLALVLTGVGGPTDEWYYVLRDLSSGTSTFIRSGVNVALATPQSGYGAMSSDGRILVLYVTDPTGVTTQPELDRFDLSTGERRRLDLLLNDVPATPLGRFTPVGISDDGRFTAFEAGRIANGTTTFDMYTRDMGKP
jgi:hypothetical protein